MDNFASTFQDLLSRLIELLPNLVTALVIFVITLYVAGLLTKITRKALNFRNADLEITMLVSQITRWSIITVGGVIAMEQIGFDLSAFLAGLGILGFTIGFALQDVSKNFISGLLLLLDQPFDIGDVIEVGDYVGTVADVSLRATELYTFDGQNVLIPNGDVFTSPIKNYSRYPKRRVELTVGVGYNSDLEIARQAALEAVASIQGLADTPAPELYYNSFGESAIDFTVYFWIDLATANYLQTIDDAITGIKTAFEQADIDIPFPIRTVHLTK